MHSSGVDNVPIEPVAGQLTDHYDPSKKILRLSADNYYPGNKEGHIPTRSASEGPMKSSESRRGSPWDD